MNILTVIPIARGISKDTLSYFTKKDVPVGSIVSIPLRKKRAYGLVVESKTASEAKSEIKTLPYSIKKVGGVESRSFLSPAFIKSAEKIADYNAASTGAVLSVLIPKPILEESVKFSHITKESPRSSFYETVLLQTDDEERYATYRSLIREEFAKNRSIFCCLPTTEELLNAKEILEKGIEKYTYILHSGLSKKEILSAWQKIISEKHPVLIIATGYFIGIPRNDLGVIILEKESSRAYKTLSRPFLDIRDVAKTIAKQLNIRLVLGDLFLRVETLWKGKSLTYSELSPLKFRSLSTAVLEVIDVHSPANMKKKEFSVLGDALKKMLQQARANNEQTFLFCGRKGLYPETICSDCGTPVTCKNCNAPVVLYGKTSKRLFVCHHCGERRDADELCRNCGGWRLLSLGIGIEKVLEEIKSVLDNTKIFIMDKDHIKNHKQAVKMRDSFYNTPGAICLGTEMALPYLKDKIENTAVVSLDSYFSIPDFRINEKIFHILLSLRALAEKRMVVQTRREDRRIFDYALHGNLIDFYRDEIEERKLVGYPPFATHVKITLEGEKNKMKKQIDDISSILKPYELSVFNAWNPGSKSKFTLHGLLSLPKDSWVDKVLLEKLRSLPPSVQVKIDPDTLL